MSNLYVNTINPAAGTKVTVAAAETHISGNLCVTGTLHAKLTDFVVSANSTTLGDEASDAITINAATASIPNSLTFDAGTLHLDAPNNRVGIGTTSPSHTLQINSNSGTEGLHVIGARNQYVASFRSNTTSGESWGPYIRGGTNTSDSSLVVDKADGTSTYFKIQGDGNVGIGVTDPDELLEVAGDVKISGANKLYLFDSGGEYLSSDGTDLTIAAGTAINVEAGTLDLSAQTVDVTLNAAVDALNFDSNTLSIDASNNRIGVGTASPGTTLQVDSNSGEEGLQVNGAQNQYVVSFRADTTTGEAYGPYIRGGTNSSDSALVIDKADGTSTYFKVRGDGNVGIGTISPETALHIQDGSAGTIATTSGALLTLESSEKPKIHFQSPGGYGGSIIFGSPTDNDEGQIDYDHGSDRFLFKTGGSTKMAILGDNVGIGTATPEHKLSVTGTFGVSGAATLSSTLQLGTGSTVYTILDDDTMGANADNALATQQSIKAYVDASVTAQDLDIIVGGSAYTVDLDSQSLTVTGTYGEVDVAMSGQTMTLGLPNNVEIDGTLTVATGILPDAQDGAYLGSSTKQWSDLFLADGGVISFGDDNEVTLTHTEDTGLELMSVSATTSHLTTPLTITAQSTGAPNAYASGGFGPSIRFKAETAAGTPGNIEHVGFVGFGATDKTGGSEDFSFLVGNIEGTGATGSANVMTASMAVTRGASNTSLYLYNDDKTHYSGYQVRHSDGVTTIGGGTSEKFVMQGATGNKNSVVAITAGTTNSATTGDACLSFAVENVDSREQWSMGVDHSDSKKFKIVTGSVSALNTAAASYMEFGSAEVVINENGESRDFRVEGDTDSHLLWVDGSGDCVSIGSNTSTPTAVLMITGDSTVGKSALSINHGDNDVIGVDVNLMTTTAVGIDVDATNTTANVLDLTCNTLTTGAAARFYSNSPSVSIRNLVEIVQDHASATASIPLHVAQDSSSPAAVIRGPMIRNPNPTYHNTSNAWVTGQTISASYCVGGTYFATARNSGQTDTFDTAANIQAAMGPGVVFGDMCEFTYMNFGSHSVTLGGGTNVIMGNMATASFAIASGKARRFLMTAYDVNPLSPKIQIFPMSDLFNITS